MTIAPEIAAVLGGTSRYAVVCGDATAVLATIPDGVASVCYCDPPYGLSKQDTASIVECLTKWLAGQVYEHGSVRKGKQNCAANILADSVVVNADHPESESDEKSIPLSIDGRLLLAVVGGAVEFDDHAALRQKEIDAHGTASPLENLLVNERDSEFFQARSNGVLRLRKLDGYAGCVGECSCFTLVGPSTFRSDVWYGRVRQTDPATGVVTLTGTKVHAVLTLDTGSGTATLAPAERASDDLKRFEVFASQRVGAVGGARRLPAEFQAPFPRRVGDAADGALPIDGIVCASRNSAAPDGAVLDPGLRGVEITTTRSALLLHENVISRLGSPIKAKTGLMDCEWDGFVPGPEAWREVNRALKPGGYCVAFSGTRTVDLLGIAIRLAGFELRNGWSWVGGQGFPKNLNVSAAVEATELTGGSRPEDIRRTSMGDDYKPSGRGRVNYDHGSGSVMNGATERDAPATDAAKQWSGHGTDVKPAVEPLIVARKELDGTVAGNVLKHGCGVLNIDAARIFSSEKRTSVFSGAKGQTQAQYGGGTTYGNSDKYLSEPHAAGRFPAAIAFVHDEECELVGVTKVAGTQAILRNESVEMGYHGGTTRKPKQLGYADADGTETVDEWQCTETCAVAELARQSGTSRSNVGKPREGKNGDGWGMSATGAEYDDTGSAARFFYNAKANASDRLAYVTCSAGCAHHESVTGVREAKTTARDVTSEHPYGVCVECGAPRTHYQHPTVKPLTLARHHAKLLSLPAHIDPIALVPFCGTGIEAHALVEAGFRVIAIDLDPRHCAMTEYRLANMGIGADEPKRSVTRKAAPPKPEKKSAQLDLFGGAK